MEKKMSISVTESRDSQRILDAADQRADSHTKAEIGAIEDFQRACAKGDANAMCQWAHMTTDWEKVQAPVVAGQPRPMRVQTLAEVMAESLDYAEGPSMTEAMQLILNAANGSNVQAQAQSLVDRMAKTWAKFNTEEA
jgi:hypothetical protein